MTDKFSSDDNWICMYSMSGSEIVNLSKQLGRSPTAIITDNNDPSTWHPELWDVSSVSIVPKKSRKDVNVLREMLGEPKNTLVTLHGWLNIIPEEICNEYTIYNGHPGMITFFPELKGKDPVERAWEKIDTYHFVGSVVHKVVPEVDSGTILSSDYIPAIFCKSLDDMRARVKKTSHEAWIKAFKQLY